MKAISENLRLEFGADPELFVINNESGVVIPAYKLLGRKRINTKFGRIIADGTALEFNPFSEYTPKKLIENVNGLMAEARKRFENNETALLICPFVDSIDQSVHSVHTRSSYNAYTPGVKTSKDKYSLSASSKRSAGGHIHIGLPAPVLSTLDSIYETNDDKKALNFLNLIKLIDMYVAIPVMQKMEFSNEEVSRRRFYGEAGEFRVTRYGFEYRTLSNCILRNNDIFAFALDRIENLLNYIICSCYNDRGERKCCPEQFVKSIYDKISPILSDQSILAIINNGGYDDSSGDSFDFMNSQITYVNNFFKKLLEKKIDPVA